MHVSMHSVIAKVHSIYSAGNLVAEEGGETEEFSTYINSVTSELKKGCPSHIWML
jgi:hypothetical protein